MTASQEGLSSMELVTGVNHVLKKTAKAPSKTQAAASRNLTWLNTMCVWVARLTMTEKATGQIITN
jgi:hypothetical protein